MSSLVKKEIVAAFDPVRVANAEEQASAPRSLARRKRRAVMQDIVADEALSRLHPNLHDQRIAVENPLQRRDRPARRRIVAPNDVALARSVAHGEGSRTPVAEENRTHVLRTDAPARLDALRDRHRLRMHERLNVS